MEHDGNSMTAELIREAFRKLSVGPRPQIEIVHPNDYNRRVAQLRERMSILTSRRAQT